MTLAEVRDGRDASKVLGWLPVEWNLFKDGNAVYFLRDAFKFYPPADKARQHSLQVVMLWVRRYVDPVRGISDLALSAGNFTLADLCELRHFRANE